MEIIIAKNSGLCYGVQRALQMAKETRKRKTEKVFTFGDLIHNPQVILDLEKQDIQSIDDLDKIEEGTVIIRSHGVSPEIYDILTKKKIEIVDATCPIVKRIQKQVAALAKKEKEIIIVGNKEHPEIKGLIGYSKEKGIIIENASQAEILPNKKRRAVLAQSTQDLFLFMAVVAALIERTEELKVFNTICQSTQTRQKSTSELASCVDTLFIIGGKNSSNTQKLYQISKRILPNTHFIEEAEQITPAMVKGAKRIGLSGGASTPPEAIQEAVAKIKSNYKHQFLSEKRTQCQS
ncbi:MAG: 4-hydroxy-3-methylbut-2-enyl diphosphate reductase [Candidatus Aminicenantes bacterium]|nr:4-hydroxy-3-methylbut-2-enyl diphosphate reductase [Candidatus Aminicenantes bacterium]MDH5384109.1 4-hydroxy-3-methylbut-2-enyl diphosphate reductase [Candidatus Aminicenantes bacterium]MDH5742277.1 4-hydroxy-3-methylbut-2-enyl diphosphate reductase [Candidatus Aminicenantes bacterium]